MMKTSDKNKKPRRTTLFPASSFEEALTLANAIQKHASGQKVRRLTLFDQMGKSPDSGHSRQLIINSNKYGLTKGGYQAEFLELTADGKVATNVETAPRDKLKARFKLAVEKIPSFNAIYENLKNNRLPAAGVLEDLVKENDIPENDAKECVEMFIVNAKFLGILKTIAGAERIIPLEQLLEEIPAQPTQELLLDHLPAAQPDGTAAPIVTHGEHEWDSICFYISPIGEPESELRNHADLFLGSIVEPALEEFKLKVIRADKIGKPGMITAQIIEYILRSKLVIADLSYHNPNVFYELCLRHVCRLPTVQLIREADKIPFDLDQFRTIQIDTSSIYKMVPNLQSYKAEIATQVRMALKDPDSADNPVSTYYPNLKASFDK
ncbi:MAG: hypothetical protein KKH66_00915 [Proteobacteria bacterium]|nr:hypothetical protein [Pseudomonadota bacterium]